MVEQTPDNEIFKYKKKIIFFSIQIRVGIPLVEER